VRDWIYGMEGKEGTRGSLLVLRKGGREGGRGISEWVDGGREGGREGGRGARATEVKCTWSGLRKAAAAAAAAAAAVAAALG